MKRIVSAFFVIGLLMGNASIKAEEMYVTIPPLKYFAEMIVGEDARIGVVLEPGQSPHSYSPSAKKIASISRAQLLFTTQVPFEEVLLPRLKVISPQLKVIDTSKGISKHLFSSCSVDHDHHHYHSEGDLDPHVWMSPRLALVQARNILNAVILWKPEKKEFFTSNYKKLEKELKTLDQFLVQELESIKGSIFFVYHPAYGYFADAYQLKQVAIESSGKAPTPATLKDIIKRAKKDRVKTIFVQKQFPLSSAKAVAEAIDGTVVHLDPLAEDYVANMKNLAMTVSGRLGK